MAGMIAALVGAGVARAEPAPDKPPASVLIATSSAFYDPQVHCADARRAIGYYRRAFTWQQEKAGLVGAPERRWYGCTATRRRAVEWRERFRVARAHLRRITLPVSGDWVTSVRIVQRVFPGTDGWLLSCSSAEGGHGRWVRFGGGAYYAGYEHTGEVGNWLQYRWPTFRGHYRHALNDLRGRGFRVLLPAPGDVRAWLSPTATAVAGGWAILHGQRSHWFASFGRGC